MTKQELDDYIKDLLSKAKDKKDDKRSVEEIVYEFYRTVAEHYNNRIPQSMHDIFISNVPKFKKYLDSIDKRVMEASKRKNSCSNDVRKIGRRLDKIEEEEIHVGGPQGSVSDEERKEYRDISSKREATRSILDVMVTESSMQNPEALNRALLYAYQMQAFTVRDKKYIDTNIHEMFVKKYPPFEQFLREFNQEDKKAEIAEELSEAEKALADAEADYKKARSKVIDVYDDSPKPTRGSYYSNPYDDGCCHGRGGGPQC